MKKVWLWVTFNQRPLKAMLTGNRHVARATLPKLCGGARAQRGAREGAKGGPGEAYLDLDRGNAEKERSQ